MYIYILHTYIYIYLYILHIYIYYRMYIHMYNTHYRHTYWNNIIHHQTSQKKTDNLRENLSQNHLNKLFIRHQTWNPGCGAPPSWSSARSHPRFARPRSCWLSECEAQKPGPDTVWECDWSHRVIVINIYIYNIYIYIDNYINHYIFIFE